MRNIYFLIICFSVLLLGCKSDKKSENQINKGEEVSTEINKNTLLNDIQNAYNINKYMKEKVVRFKINLKVEDSIFFEGFLSVKTDKSEIKVTNSLIDTVLTSFNDTSSFEKTIFWISEIYTLPFLIDDDNFSEAATDDKYSNSNYKSAKTDYEYKIYTNPITNIIDKVKYKTSISSQSFDDGELYFDKYITVNRIPVAMQWNIEIDGEKFAKAEISRISYPNRF